MLIYNSIKYSVFVVALGALSILTLVYAADQAPATQAALHQAPKNKTQNKGKPGRPCKSARGDKGVYNKDGVCGPVSLCKKVGQACVWPECTTYPCPMYFYVTGGTCNEKLECVPRHGVPITEGY